MKLKVNKKPSGIPEGTFVVAPGVTSLGAAQVTGFVSSIDATSGISEGVAARLSMSVAEARDLAARLMKAAEEAEAQAAAQKASKS